jgi:glucosyl-3-phosphoglycerate phosphatase
VARVTDARTLVYLARHGQTALNESGVLRGLLDPPLDDTGRRQAALLGQVLGPRHPSLVAASPLRRARETAQPTADRAGLSVTTDRCFADRDYGQWAGTPKDTVAAQWGSVDAAPGVEPRPAVRDRAVRGLMTLTERFPGATLVVVSHDAVNQEVLAALDPGLGDPAGIEQDNGCYNVLQWTAGGVVVLGVNEHPDGT